MSVVELELELAFLDVIERRVMDRLIEELEAAVDRACDGTVGRALVEQDSKLRSGSIPINDWLTVMEIDREVGVCIERGVRPARSWRGKRTGPFTYMKDNHKFALKLGQHVSHRLVYKKSREQIHQLDLVGESLDFLLDIYKNDNYNWWWNVVGDAPWGLIVEEMFQFMRERIPSAYVKYAANLDYSPRRIKVDNKKFWDPFVEFDGREVLAIH